MSDICIVGFNCLIVDDDPVVCELLGSYCKELPAISSTSVANTGIEAISALGTSEFDLVFLDLNLPEMNGRDILQIMPSNAQVVMITSDSDFAVESYNFKVAGFLLKPFTLADLTRAIDRLDAPKPKEHLFVKDAGTMVKIELKDLRYIKSESNYVTFYTKTGKVMSLMRLSDLEEKLLPAEFLRIHRSYIVNANKIDKVGTNYMYLGEDELPLSATYREAVLQALDLPH